jgi:APA family basic amino acid/polyamine antiporter
VFWEPLRSSPADVVAGIAIVVGLGVLNILGAQESSFLNIFFAVADFMTQVVLVVAGLVLVFSPETLVQQVDLGRVPTLGNFLLAIPVGMVAYTGIETISNMAEEARDYGRTIPRGILGVVLAVAAIYAFLPAIALSAMPVRDGQTALATEYAGDPVLGVVENMDLGPLQAPMEIYVGVLAATILFIATNAGLIGVSRLTYSMGQYRQLPERLRALHPRFRTPYVAITVFGLVACLTIVPGQADFLGTIYAFGAMLSFTMAHLSVIRLRMVQPDRERPYRGPGNLRLRGVELPLFAVLGALGTGTAWVVVTVLDRAVLVSGVVWLGVGIAVYALYRRHQGLALTQTAKVIVPKPIVEHEVEYDSILVAFENDQYSREAVLTAVKLAARRRRGVHVLVVLTVPQTSPIDVSLPGEERRAESVIAAARALGGRRVTGHWEKARRGEAGRRIVAEAREIRARAIVMTPSPRRPGGSLLGPTLEAVLEARPCRVIVESAIGVERQDGFPRQAPVAPAAATRT